MRRLILGTAALLLASAAVVEAQERRVPPPAQQDDQSWLNPGPAPRRGGPDYVDEGEDQSAVDGGISGGDLFDQDLLPGTEDGPEDTD